MAAKITTIHFGVAVILHKNQNFTFIDDKSGYDIKLDRVDQVPCIILTKDGQEWCVFASNVRTFRREQVKPPAKK